jgi:hypothetical protein
MLLLFDNFSRDNASHAANVAVLHLLVEQLGQLFSLANQTNQLGQLTGLASLASLAVPEIKAASHYPLVVIKTGMLDKNQRVVCAGEFGF